MWRPSLALLGCSALGAPVCAQSLSCERYRLENGMTVILHEDHSVPQACVDVWFRVGSKDEPPGRSGFAHLFEHLMFMGTERVPGADFDLLMEAGGGTNNATTSFDRTSYFESGPSELLPTLLWLEADRIEDLGRMLTREKLDAQREVVRNERRQSYEIQPYGRSVLKSFELLYPPDHPYHVPVIGSHADLEAATLEDAQSFFATYYVPSNASLVVAGDFDRRAIKPLVEALFGGLPRGDDVVHARAQPVRLEASIEHTMTDAVQFARLALVWHSPPRFQAGDAEMDLLAGIFADGVSSRLYRELVTKSGKAVEVDAYQSSRALGSTFHVEALASPGTALGDLEGAIDAVLRELVESGPSERELLRRVAAHEREFLAGLQSLVRRAEWLNTYELHFGEPDAFARDLERYRSATPEGLGRWARDVLGAPRLALRVLPGESARGRAARDERPAPPAPSDFAPPAPTAFELPNSLDVKLWTRRDLPLVELALVLPFGSATDPPGKAGRAYLTADMLDESAGGRGAAELAAELELLGARLSVSVETELSTVRLGVLRRNWEAALQLFADVVLRPDFDEREWERVRRVHLQRLRADQDSPDSVAKSVGLAAYFGAGHPYGHPPEGTLEGVANLERGDLQLFHRAAFRPDRAVLLVAGDIDARAASDTLVASFSRWVGLAALDPPAVPPFVDPGERGQAVVLVDKPGAVQTLVRFMIPAPPATESRRLERELLATLLGGSFTSRLNQNLREEHGYAYGAGARLVQNARVGYLLASATVRADATGPALSEFLAEFRGLASRDVSADEARKARALYRRGVVDDFASLEGILAAAAELFRDGRDVDSLARDLARLPALGPSELNAWASESLPLGRALLVLVGDRARVLEGLGGLGLPAPRELDAAGRPVQGR